MKDNQRKSKTPANCPICHVREGFIDTGVCIADGFIYKCKECSGYFLFPSTFVEYTDSQWSSGREEGWQRDTRIAKKLAPKILEYVEAYLGRPVKSIFEIGCGSAFMGVGFNSLGCDYTGIDVDAKSIELAQNKGINAHCIAMENIHDAPETIVHDHDLVMSSNVFEHLDDPSKAFVNLRLICNGIVVIIVPNAKGLFARVRSNKVCSKMIQKILGTKREIAYTIDGYWHNISYSKQTLEYLCAKAGIEVIKFESMSINDPTFGFVQSNRTLRYRLASTFAALVKMDSAIMVVGQLVKS